MTRFHPLADAFPLLTGAEFDELVKDIDQHGLHQPVVMYDGLILDGRNRWRACQQLGKAHREIKFTGDDPAAYVWSTNAVRRQLTASQKALAAAKLANATVGGQPGNRNRAKVKETPGTDAIAQASANQSAAQRDGMTVQQTAKMTGAAPRSIEGAKRIIREGAPEVVQAVEEGTLTLEAAGRLVKKPLDEQVTIMKTVPAADIPSVVPPEKRLPAAPVPGGFQEPGKSAPVGRGRPGPRFQLQRQMNLPELHMIKGVLQDWTDNAALIKEMDRDELYTFVRLLRQSKTHYTRLINLIESAVSEENTGDQET